MINNQDKKYASQEKDSRYFLGEVLLIYHKGMLKDDKARVS